MPKNEEFSFEKLNNMASKIVNDVSAAADILERIVGILRNCGFFGLKEQIFLDKNEVGTLVISSDGSLCVKEESEYVGNIEMPKQYEVDFLSAANKFSIKKCQKSIMAYMVEKSKAAEEKLKDAEKLLDYVTAEVLPLKSLPAQRS
jgi:hypothetical protein